MRKNDSSSKKGPKKAPGAGGAGEAKRAGKPRSGGGFKSGAEGRGSGSFGSRAEGGFDKKSKGRKFDQRPGADRDERRPLERGSGRFGGFGETRSTDWSTGGYRITKKGAGAKKTGEFRGYKKDSESAAGGFGGSRTEGFRGARRGAEPRTEGFRGTRKDAEPRSAGLKGNRGFEVRGKKVNTGKKFENKQYKEEIVSKKEAIKDYPEADSFEHEDRVEGRNPVFEALRSGRPLNKLFVEKDSEDTMITRIIAMARERNIPIQYLERKKLDSMSQTRIHQGVILDVAAQEYVEVEDILAKAAEKEEKPFVLVLDEITDTNNLGSIIRSAECAGVHGIIIPKRRSATLNATVAKVAAGALEYVPVARVTNLVQTLRDLKNEGLWIIAADMDGESNYYDTDLKGPCALVIGSEGEGISRLVRNECDLIVKIPMKGKISSLNAGVAAALIMFEISKQRG